MAVRVPSNDSMGSLYESLPSSLGSKGEQRIFCALSVLKNAPEEKLVRVGCLGETFHLARVTVLPGEGGGSGAETPATDLGRTRAKLMGEQV
ncbi:hypothetical protein GWK47_008453 [Chionoecetes opilio]|uniref:Uncharacterized protein n=1 Tax=Chionoecetes opilio TaxID=41210 RepID=A0A8J5CR96_CHIOP|nr:hypothetical protein GWK47_008453 [Chionoecetes opilio]